MWRPGDKRRASEAELKRLQIEGHYDSYEQHYLIDGKRWKVVNKIAAPDYSTIYILECVEES